MNRRLRHFYGYSWKKDSFAENGDDNHVWTYQQRWSATVLANWETVFAKMATKILRIDTQNIRPLTRQRAQRTTKRCTARLRRCGCRTSWSPDSNRWTPIRSARSLVDRWTRRRQSSRCLLTGNKTWIRQGFRLSLIDCFLERGIIEGDLVFANSMSFYLIYITSLYLDRT